MLTHNYSFYQENGDGRKRAPNDGIENIPPLAKRPRITEVRYIWENIFSCESDYSTIATFSSKKMRVKEKQMR
jgi:hypothetical protein